MAVIRYNSPLYTHEDKKYSDKGTTTIPTYVLDYPERGGVCLKQTGDKPIYEIIQSNLVNCDLQNVIESCVHTNQFAVTSQDNLNTMIADFTGLTNMGDIYAGAKRLENTWNDLPLEVRESFDSDIKKFIRGIGTEDFNSKVENGFAKFNDNLRKNTSINVPLPDVVPDTTVQPSVVVPNNTVQEV